MESGAQVEVVGVAAQIHQDDFIAAQLDQETHMISHANDAKIVVDRCVR